MSLEPTASQGRLLIVPGLHDSPPDHWQSWLQALFPGALRVTQRDWAKADIERWAGRVGSALERAGPGPCIAVAHSFGALAVARHLALVPDTPLAAVLLVAPADPDRFGIADWLPQQPLRIPGTLLLSSNDPWLSLAAGQRWAQRWGAPCLNLGQAGHINVASGFHTLPYARQWVLAQLQRLNRAAAGRKTQPETAASPAWSD
jgi:predicted alpha/beta hydrolase family esterase